LISQLLAAVAFLTRIPVGRWFAPDAKQVARSERWFPLVGALLGGIFGAAVWICAPYFPALVVAILVAALDAWLTGAMHLDGLADTADGFGGGSSREDVLRIMRDHAIGSYGAVAVVLAIALKVAAVAALIGLGRAISALVVACVLGRWSAVLLSVTQPYARPPAEDGRLTAGSPARFVGRVELLIASVSAIALAVLCGGWRGGAACGLAAAVSVLWGWRCRRRIGGVTGDTLGTAIVATECLVLLLFVAQ
jgi:adenosylcobinamide-GDP ribazoletransferase